MRAWSGNAPTLIAHRPSYFADDKVKRLVARAVERYGAADVCAAVAAYAQVLASPDHFFNYRWTLGDFLTRGLDRFVPEADPLENFRSKHGDRREGLTGEQIEAVADEAARAAGDGR